MIELKKFNFATVICDGCAKRVDSECDDERLFDRDDLVEWVLPDQLGWHQIDLENDEKWFCPECAKNEKHRRHPGEGRIIVEPTELSGVRCDLCGCLAGEDVGECFFEFEGVAFDKSGFMEINGKHYCEDCWEECRELDNPDGDCKGCPKDKWCEGQIPREIPRASERCTYAFKPEGSKVNWVRCPFLKSDIKGIYSCALPKGEKCPRKFQWLKDRLELEKSNARILKEIEDWERGKSRDAK